MNYLGDFNTGTTVRMMWSTSGTDGSSITRATDGTLKIYKDGSATERTSLAGVTQTEDFDSATGAHLVAIDLSDNTDAGFYAAGHDYHVVMTGMVIDGKTVNSPIGHFSIENRNIKANVTQFDGIANGLSGGLFAPIYLAGTVLATSTQSRVNITAGTSKNRSFLKGRLIQIGDETRVITGGSDGEVVGTYDYVDISPATEIANIVGTTFVIFHSYSPKIDSSLRVTSLDSTEAAFTYTTPLTAATTRAAIGMAAANLDTQLNALPTIQAKTDQLTFTTPNVVDASGSGGGGSGASLVTITVNDGTNPIEGAVVALYSNDVLNGYGTTNVSGVVQLTPNSGDVTYTVAILKASYSFTPTTLAVSGATSHAYSMSLISVSPEVDPLRTTLYFTAYDDDNVATSGINYEFVLVEPGLDTGYSFSRSTITATSAGAGLVQVSLLQSSNYKGRRIRADGKESLWIDITTGNTSTTRAPGILGAPND